jgi:cytochrome P450
LEAGCWSYFHIPTRWRSYGATVTNSASGEELLRYTSPVFMSTERYAREDVAIHDVTISRGEMTLGVIGSANRDEAAFDNADALDITREDNKHLSFGHGMHFCLGAPLARLETQIAINTPLERMPDLRLKVAPDAMLAAKFDLTRTGRASSCILAITLRRS